jgi:multidrug efflux system membrane fusion protein
MDMHARESRAAGLATLALICVAVLVAGVTGRRLSPEARSAPERARDAPRAVSLATVRTRAMPVLLQASAFVVSEHVVQVRPQISGLLRLVQGHYVTPQDYINARASAEQADAAYRRAKINLSYTVIRASVSGRSGGLNTRTGNLVAPTDGAPLVTINQTRPIEVQFSLAQQFLPRLRESMAQGALQVAVLREDGGDELDRGQVVFIDNAVNAGTGTLTLKARLPNEHEQLWPGQYVTVRVQLAIEPHALVVPESALQTGAAGNYVYVLEGGKAARREVTVNRHAGELAVIAAGLKDGEQVVERVPTGLRPGMVVTPGRSVPPPRERIRLSESGS